MGVPVFRMPSLRKDDVALFYREAPGTVPAIVLVHGWCCDHTYFDPQFDHFAARGHRVIAPDLRGHGRSDKPEGRYSMQSFADDLAWLCGELGLVRPVLIGHSMGGVVVFDLAARYPDLASAIVMLDAAVVLPESARAGLLQFIERMRASDYRDVVRNYVADVFFIPTDDAGRKARILNDMVTAPRQVMFSMLEGLRDYDPRVARGRLAVPSLYIAADEPHPRSEIPPLRDLVPHMQYGQTVGSGHFCQLEVPDQINAMIDRFLAIALGANVPRI
jgi:pimeloyl-ACP methyl ester carboxylesterase